MDEPLIEDRGSYIEVSLTARRFAHGNFVDVLAAAAQRFGWKPMLVICNDPSGVIGNMRAYDVGVELSEKLPFSRIAIALTRRKSSSADRFTELVAENRCTVVRYFDSVVLAKSWLGVS
jgi:hypothetical protein